MFVSKFQWAGAAVIAVAVLAATGCFLGIPATANDKAAQTDGIPLAKAPPPAQQKKAANSALPGAIKLKFNQTMTINANSRPIRRTDPNWCIVRIGKGTFQLSKKAHLKAKLHAGVMQYANVDYWIYAAVFDAKHQLLGTAAHKEREQYIRIGVMPMTFREIDLDFGASNAFRRAEYVVVTISEPTIPDPPK